MRSYRLFALCVLATSCSLSTTDVTNCVSTTECRQHFGVGFVCADDGLCEEAEQLNRCTSVFPSDLFSNPDLGRDAIVIGTLFDRSLATHRARENSARLALRQADRLDKRKFGGVFCTIEKNDTLDSLERTDAAVRAAEYLAKVLEVPAIVGPASSTDTAAVFEHLATNTAGQTLVISPSATSPSLTALDPIGVGDDNPGLLWRTAPPDSEQGRAIASDMAKPGIGRTKAVSKVLVIHEEGAYGQGLSDVFIEEFKLLTGGAGAADPVAYRRDDVDGLLQIATDASKREVDEVLFISSQATEANAFLQAVDTAWEVGYNDKNVFLTDGAANADAIANIPARAFTNVRGSRPAPVDAEQNLVFLNFSAAYKAEYDGEDPRGFSFSANTYDAAWLVLYGIAWAQFQENGISARNIAKGLRRISRGQRLDVSATNWGPLQQQFRAGQSVNVYGASGALDYDPTSEETSSDVQIWRVKDGTIAAVDTWTPPKDAD